MFDALILGEGGFEGLTGFAGQGTAELGLGVGGGDVLGLVAADELHGILVEQQAVDVLFGADGVAHLLELGEDVLERLGVRVVLGEDFEQRGAGA